LGKIQARHPQVADLYQVEVAEQGAGVSLHWKAIEGRQDWQRAREGAYLLRTNLPAEKPEILWKNQLERRSKAHILVAFLGYALWVTLKRLLIGKGANLSPAKALALLGPLVSADIVLPTTDGREIRLRRVTTQNAEQKQLLDQLGIRIPDRLSSDQECSVDSAVA